MQCVFKMKRDKGLFFVGRVFGVKGGKIRIFAKKAMIIY